MEKENKIVFKVTGKYALFSDPITRVGGEKMSYSVPTYEALRGICESIYWKPTFVWEPMRVKIVNEIMTESKNTLVPKIKWTINEKDGKGRKEKKEEKNDLFIYTYLRNVEYIVEARFVWNENRPDLECDRNENKHYFIAKRMLERGGRRDIYLGTRESQGYVMPCGFDDVKSYYEGTDLNFGIMVHGITYPEKEDEKNMEVRLWNVHMKDGVINFIRPDECTITMPSTKYSVKHFEPGVSLTLADDMEKEGWLD